MIEVILSLIKKISSPLISFFGRKILRSCLSILHLLLYVVLPSIASICQPHRQATCAAVLSSEVLAAAQTGSNVASPTSRMSVQERKTEEHRDHSCSLILLDATCTSSAV